MQWIWVGNGEGGGKSCYGRERRRGNEGGGRIEGVAKGGNEGVVAGVVTAFERRRKVKRRRRRRLTGKKDIQSLAEREMNPGQSFNKIPCAAAVVFTRVSPKLLIKSCRLQVLRQTDSHRPTHTNTPDAI